ncbi:MAG: hypothetical protein LBU34_01930, partial [Planctomycetaceae bacterium]|nr:hypothetical protein [Planctomycetaceae bacterium]
MTFLIFGKVQYSVIVKLLCRTNLIFNLIFPNKTTLAAKKTSNNQPYYLIKKIKDKVIRLMSVEFWATKVVLLGNQVENKVMRKYSDK